VENRLIESIRDYDEKCLTTFSRDVLKRLRSGDASWESMVPREVAEAIKKRKLLGYVEKTRHRRAGKQANPGLIDSVHLAGMPKAAA
jgi:hypothetical protein